MAFKEMSYREFRARVEALKTLLNSSLQLRSHAFYSLMARNKLVAKELFSCMLVSSHRAMIQMDLLNVKQLTTLCVYRDRP